MAEYIERETLSDAFENADTNVCEDYGDSCEWGYSLKRVKEIIYGVPATDVAPVVHGGGGGGVDPAKGKTPRNKKKSVVSLHPQWASFLVPNTF